VTPLLPVADGDLVLFAETEDGQVVGWLPGIPNLNEALIHAGGQRYPWNYLPTTRAPRSSPGISARLCKRCRVYRKLRDLVLDKTYDIPYHLSRRSE
jgi:hypothetical protein